MLVTILTVLELVYIVGLGTWILLEKRSPVSTLAWILGLIALPYVGFVVFFFLGPRRVEKKRLRFKRARETQGTIEALECHPHDWDRRAAQLVKLAVSAGEPPAEHCEDVRIYGDAESTYDAIIEAVGKATHHVHVAYYIFDPRRSGTRLRDALIERAKAGVMVRLLVDDVGSSAIGKAFLEPMLKAGVKFARFNQVLFSRVRSRIDFRNHRKIVVCDGTVGFVGGINIADEYLPELPEGEAPASAGLAIGSQAMRDRSNERKRRKRNHLGPWRDTHMRLEGDVVRWLQLVFADDWFYATGYATHGKVYFPDPTRKGDQFVQIVSSGPDREIESIQKLYFAAIAGARERVYVTTPYFIPDEASLTALTATALRGVDVRVLVPRRSDSLVVTAAARSYYDTIIKAGVKVYEYQPTMIHSKTLVVDDYFAAVGTANFDNRSFRLNFEVTGVVYGEKYAQELADMFFRDLEKAVEITAGKRRNVSLGWRLGEAGARVLSPLL